MVGFIPYDISSTGVPNTGGAAIGPEISSAISMDHYRAQYNQGQGSVGTLTWGHVDFPGCPADKSVLNLTDNGKNIHIAAGVVGIARCLLNFTYCPLDKSQNDFLVTVSLKNNGKVVDTHYETISWNERNTDSELVSCYFFLELDGLEQNIEVEMSSTESSSSIYTGNYPPLLTVELHTIPTTKFALVCSLTDSRYNTVDTDLSVPSQGFQRILVSGIGTDENTKLITKNTDINRGGWLIRQNITAFGLYPTGFVTQDSTTPDPATDSQGSIAASNWPQILSSNSANVWDINLDCISVDNGNKFAFYSGYGNGYGGSIIGTLQAVEISELIRKEMPLMKNPAMSTVTYATGTVTQGGALVPMKVDEKDHMLSIDSNNGIVYVIESAKGYVSYQIQLDELENKNSEENESIQFVFKNTDGTEIHSRVFNWFDIYTNDAQHTISGQFVVDIAALKNIQLFITSDEQISIKEATLTFLRPGVK